MRRHWLVLITIFLVALLSVGYFLFTEEVEVQVPSGATIKARSNPYLAAERFLQANNVLVESEFSQLDFNKIPTGTSVLLNSVDTMLLTTRQIDDALTWIDNGGFLMVGVNETIEGGTSLLDFFDISIDTVVYENTDNFVDEDGEPLKMSEILRKQNEEIKKRRAEQKDSNATPATDTLEEIQDLLEFEPEIYLLDMGEEIVLELQALDSIVLLHESLSVNELESDDIDADLEFEAESAIDAPGDPAPYALVANVDDDHGSRLLQFTYGAGTFTAFSSMILWQNDHIGAVDHAYFLKYMVPPDSSLALYYDVPMPSLFVMLKNYFGELLFSIGVLVLLWVWYSSIRTVGSRKVWSTQRRQFSEHLSASAEYLLKNERFNELLQPIKAEIMSQMQRVEQNFSEYSQGEQVQFLVEQSQISEQHLSSWYAKLEHCSSEQDYFEVVRQSQYVMSKLDSRTINNIKS